MLPDVIDDYFLHKGNGERREAVFYRCARTPPKPATRPARTRTRTPALVHSCTLVHWDHSVQIFWHLHITERL